ncbi:serine/threonine protein kinase [Sedimentibacter sp. zth1]|nr:serine/threonine protein kinase [Sedimentibacter sp. zth1]QSX07346.1 serine/threonine protein kinase [Sedimentibacter sp. zth1]
MIKKIDNIKIELKKDYDFEWLREYGEVFCAFDQQDSGNICFGIKDGNKKLFIKYAGAPTVDYDGKYEDAIDRMKKSVSIYEDIQHPNLVKLIEHYEKTKGYVSIYEWAEGESLHAHWDFYKYPKYIHPSSPNYKFNLLDLKYKLDSLEKIYDFHKLIAKRKYVAVDFYDGSLMYDFKTNNITICDIDFYKKTPLINTMGRMWGSSRFMSPEEFQKGAIIDEITNVYTMGAVAFELLGSNSNRNIEHWSASQKLFNVAKKAVNNDRNQRYKSISEFYDEWIKAQ